jgi:hypothetical protein
MDFKDKIKQLGLRTEKMIRPLVQDLADWF